MAKTKNSDFPMILIGRQFLDGEVVFSNVLRMCETRADYNRFKAEVKANAKAMFGKFFRKGSLMGNAIDQKWSFKFTNDVDCDYEQWIKAKTGAEFWEKAGRIAAGKAAR